MAVFFGVSDRHRGVGTRLEARGLPRLWHAVNSGAHPLCRPSNDRDAVSPLARSAREVTNRTMCGVDGERREGAFYSCRRASMGSILAAREAGYRPKITPIAAEIPKARTSDHAVMIVLMSAK
jgi:hypothetical protein